MNKRTEKTERTERCHPEAARPKGPKQGSGPFASLRVTPLLLSALCVPLSAQQLDLSRSRLVDLTHPLNAATLFWPTSPSGFALERLAYGPTPRGFFYAANAFSMPEHGGTHIDAPIHFGEGKRTVDAIPLEQLVAPAVVIDVSAQAARDQDYRLTPGDVRAFEQRHGAIRPGTIVLYGDRKSVV